MSRVRAVPATAVAVVVLALAGCGGDDASTPAASPTPRHAAKGTTAAPRSTPTRAPSRGGFARARAAGATSQGKVEGSTVTSMSLDKGWAVTVITTDGDNADLELSADGTKVTRGPTKNVEGAGDRTTNLAFVAAATLDYADALDRLPDTVAGGHVSTLSLERDGSRTVWRVDVTDAKGDDHEVELDAATGTVLGDS